MSSFRSPFAAARSFALGTTLATALAIAGPFATAGGLLHAQQPSGTEALAAAWIGALVPATDDPDAEARNLLQTALAEPRSPVACLLVQEVMNGVESLQRPGELRAWLLPQLWHGVRLLAQRLRGVPDS